MTTKAFSVTGSQSISGPCPSCAGTGFRRCKCGSRGPAELGDSVLGQVDAELAHDMIVPFEHINGIVPGLTSFRAVAAFFGAPDVPLTFVDEGTTWSRRYGIAVGVKGGIVEFVTATSPFQGKTSNGR